MRSRLVVPAAARAKYIEDMFERYKGFMKQEGLEIRIKRTVRA